MSEPDVSCHTCNVDATLFLGQQGRVVIPAEVRAALGLEVGDELRLHVEDERLVLERPDRAARQLRGMARAAGPRSFVEELLAERRAEARNA